MGLLYKESHRNSNYCLKHHLQCHCKPSFIPFLQIAAGRYVARKIASALSKPQTQHNVVPHSTAEALPQKCVSPAASHSLNASQVAAEKTDFPNGAVNYFNGEATEQ